MIDKKYIIDVFGKYIKENFADNIDNNHEKISMYTSE